MGGGRDKSGAPVYKKVNGVYVRIAPYKDKKKRYGLVAEKQKLKEMGLTGTEADKLLRHQNRNGDVTYHNPENGKVVAELHADGKTNIHPNELHNLRYKNTDETEKNEPTTTVDDVVGYINSGDSGVKINVRKGFEWYDNWKVEVEYRSKLGENVTDEYEIRQYTGKSLLNVLNKSRKEYLQKNIDLAEMYAEEGAFNGKQFSNRQLAEDAIWKSNYWNKILDDLNDRFGTENEAH